MRRTLWAALAVGLLALAIPAAAGAAKTAAPASLAFAATEVDQQSATQSINVGIGAGDGFRTTSIYASECGAGGACQSCPPSGFCNWKIVSNTCPVTFPAGNQTCVISVAFTPYDLGSPGIKYGAINVGTGWTPSAVTLTGTATLTNAGGGKKKKCNKRKGKSAAAAKKKGCKKKKR